MRRARVVFAAIVVVAAVVVYVRAGGHPGPRGTAGTAPRIVLLAQEAPNQVGTPGVWTTTRHLSVSCRPHPGVGRSSSGSARSLCKALAYYASHRPTKRCTVIGPLAKYRRVVISGQLNGRSVQFDMGIVCNPPPALAHAVQTIYVAAFGSLYVRPRAATTSRGVPQ